MHMDTLMEPIDTTSNPNSRDSLKQGVAAQSGKCRVEPNEVANIGSFLPQKSLYSSA